MARALLAAVLVVVTSLGAVVAFMQLPLWVQHRLPVCVALVAVAVWGLVRLRLVDPQKGSVSTLLAGMTAPVLAGGFGLMTYFWLTEASTDRDSDFAYRLAVTVAAMAAPGIATLAFAAFTARRRALGAIGKGGVALAILSLALTWIPINGLFNRQQQSENLALDLVAAPPFDTVDIRGERHRLEDHAGKVVLVNVWATWCGPCRREMPQLEQLYHSRKDDGLMVFGLSTEEAELQRRFAEDVVVSYPLLTVEGDMPETYSQTARYPANFVVDRKGQLRSAPSTDEPFANLEAMVDSLLASAGPDAGPGSEPESPTGE